MLVGNEIALPYERPQLFSLLRKGGNHTAEKLRIHDAAWFQKHHVDLRLDTLVTQFNIERRLAVLGNGQAANAALLDTVPCAPQYRANSNAFYLRSPRT